MSTRHSRSTALQTHRGAEASGESRAERAKVPRNRFAAENRWKKTRQQKVGCAPSTRRHAVVLRSGWQGRLVLDGLCLQTTPRSWTQNGWFVNRGILETHRVLDCVTAKTSSSNPPPPPFTNGRRPRRADPPACHERGGAHHGEVQTESAPQRVRGCDHLFTRRGVPPGRHDDAAPRPTRRCASFLLQPANRAKPNRADSTHGRLRGRVCHRFREGVQT